MLQKEKLDACCATTLHVFSAISQIVFLMCAVVCLPGKTWTQVSYNQNFAFFLQQNDNIGLTGVERENCLLFVCANSVELTYDDADALDQTFIYGLDWEEIASVGSTTMGLSILGCITGIFIQCINWTVICCHGSYQGRMKFYNCRLLWIILSMVSMLFAILPPMYYASSFPDMGEASFNLPGVSSSDLQSQGWQVNSNGFIIDADGITISFGLGADIGRGSAFTWCAFGAFMNFLAGFLTSLGFCFKPGKTTYLPPAAQQGPGVVVIQQSQPQNIQMAAPVGQIAMAQPVQGSVAQPYPAPVQATVVAEPVEGVPAYSNTSDTATGYDSPPTYTPAIDTNKV